MHYILLLASILLTTLGQVFQKLGAAGIKEGEASGKGITRVIFNPYVILGGICLASGAFSWLVVLSRMELSLAYPMLSLGYVLVALVSRFGFKEKVPGSRWLGVCVIMLGIALLAQT